MTNVLESIETQGIFPVIEIDDCKSALPLAEALRDGGINALEITLRTDVALDAIHTISRAFPDMLVGAGTVLDADQVDSALDAGAQFIVAPGFNPKVVAYCQQEDVLIIPGVDSATGIELALDMGLSVVKFFPAAYLGGIQGLKSLANPFKQRMRYIPLGGMSLDNLEEYARFPQVLAVGGTWIASQDLIRQGYFATIRKNAMAAMARLHGFAVSRVSFCDGTSALPETLSAFFPAPACGLKNVKTSGSPFTAKGEIEILCNSVERAALCLRTREVAMDMASAVYQQGLLKSIYLEEKISGFQVKLVLREG
jgi:2-dehydro-3-deoxyphosphogluconate aldolase/(4S)-4-hydroxy-2-oxoglutarate aldolase